MKRQTMTDNSKRKTPPMSDSGRENHLINLAYNLVEQRLIDGTASSQETTSILKLASAKEQLELEKLKRELYMIDAKTEQLKSQANVEKLYSDAIKAMKAYSGNDEDDEYGI